MARKLINTKEQYDKHYRYMKEQGCSDDEAKLYAETISHEEWVDLRKRSIGGSDAGAVAGMNAYSSLITLYADKKGLSKEREDNEAMRLGRDLEQYVADRYMEKTGNKVRNDNYMYADDDYDFITANIDRRIVGQNAGLECKTMSSFNGYNLEANEIPGYYYCQCQHYCMVMGFDYMDLAILVFQRGVYVIRINRDDDFIAMLRNMEVDFWINYIEADVIPAPDGSESSLETLKDLYPTSIPESEIEIKGLDEMIRDYKAAAELAKEYEEKKTAIQAKICKALGDNEIGIGIEYGVTWKTQSRESVDTKKLKADFPEIYMQVCKVSSYRRFNTKQLKGKRK